MALHYGMLAAFLNMNMTELLLLSKVPYSQPGDASNQYSVV
jgi:hypothetical protein